MDNILNENKKYGIENKNIKEMFEEREKINETDKPVYMAWEPKWIRLKMQGYTIPITIYQGGEATQRMRRTPDGYVDIPENLAKEVESGQLDPTMYTREQLRQMSIAKHQREEELLAMAKDEYEIVDDEKIIKEDIDKYVK